MSTSFASDRTRQDGPGFAAGQYGSRQETSNAPASCQAVGKMVRNYPASSLLVTIGLGFGLGVLLGAALARPAKKKGAMTRLGESVWNAMSSVVPESMKK